MYTVDTYATYFFLENTLFCQSVQKNTPSPEAPQLGDSGNRKKAHCTILQTTPF